MSKSVFNIDEIDEFSKEILKIANKDFPSETNKFLKNEGNKLKRKTLSLAKRKTNQKTGNYYKGIKAGKVYNYGNSKNIRVYGGKPAYHTHLIEYGHRLVKDGKEKGFVNGLNVFGEARENYRDKFYDNIDGFIDGIVSKF